MSVYVTGDVHCPIDISKLNTKRWPQQRGLTKEDILIQLGDFGIIWAVDPRGIKKEQHWIKWFDNKPYTTLFVPGNHENWTRLREFPVVEMFGGKVRKISDSIYMMERGEIYDIQGKRFFAFGGATSVDKNSRIVDVSWWQAEVATWEEESTAVDNLNRVGNKVDFIVTHTAPSTIVQMIARVKADCPVARFFEFVANSVEYSEWHFGHMHEDTVIGKFYCHYNKSPLRIIK